MIGLLSLRGGDVRSEGVVRSGTEDRGAALALDFRRAARGIK
jgi:hypothetical protein